MAYLPDDWIQKRELELAEKQAGEKDNERALQAIQLQQETASIAREQLDLSEVLDTLEHLLRGHILKYVDIEGAEVQKWVEPTDRDLVVLTDFGVHFIMNTITFYLNKNTLLANYDTDTILQKMRDFAHSLNRAVFLKQEKIFVQPTNEDCMRIFNERIAKKTEMRKFTCQLLNIPFDEAEVKKEFIEKAEASLQKEFEKIREREQLERYKQYEIIIREVQDAVHSTYLRAWNGQERRTLRQNIHTTESLGMEIPSMRPQRSSGGGFSPMKLFRRG